MLDCENPGLVHLQLCMFYIWFTWTHSNYSSAYFRNQESELGLFVLWQRTSQACFPFGEDEILLLKECGFQKTVSTNCVTPLAPFTISDSPQGKTRDGTQECIPVCAFVRLCAFESASVLVFLERQLVRRGKRGRKMLWNCFPASPAVGPNSF